MVDIGGHGEAETSVMLGRKGGHHVEALGYGVEGPQQMCRAQALLITQWQAP